MTAIRLNPAPFLAAATGALATLLVVGPVLVLLQSGVLDNTFDSLRNLAATMLEAAKTPNIGQLMLATFACFLSGGIERAKASKTLGPYAVLVYGLTCLDALYPTLPVSLLLPVVLMWPFPSSKTSD